METTESRQTEPRCPRCKERPRHRTKTGRLTGYCSPCNADKVRERSGYTPAQRTCEGCGNQYRGNNRGNAQLCQNCRVNCVTCGEKKSKGDLTHTQCYRCRALNKICVTCRENPPLGNRRECWSCLDKDGAEGARHRDGLYSLEPGQYDQMLAKQGAVCLISGLPETSVSKATGKVYPLAVDHDRACCPGNRSCGKCVRGLVRRNINVLLGMANDDPALLRACADYIERFRTNADAAASPTH
jgi:Recombination endonuclease VII